MKREQKTQLLLEMSAKSDSLKELPLKELKSTLEDNLGFEISIYTITAYRNDLGWPKLRKKAVKVETRLANLESKVDYLCRQLNIDLPAYLQVEEDA